MSARKYDLVLYGATGYVGALALDYIVKQPYDLKYAVAGRTKSKLEALLAKIPQHERFDIVIASSDDEASLRSMAKSARCILSTVGPYSLYGELLFKICAEEGTHYTDLTGETPFQMKMYQQHHETAVKTGAIMLSAAGFDSLPADLNAALAVRALQKKAPSSEVGRVQAAYKVKGGVSGGTLASMSEFIKLPTSAKTEIAKNAYVLSPIKGEAKRKMQLVTDMVDGNYGSLWVMGATNERNVYRTWGLLEGQDEVPKYGKKFQYEEHLSVKSYWAALALSSAFAFFFGLMHIGFLRPYLIKMVTDESEESRENGYVTVKTTATTADGRDSVASIFKGAADPGYKLTCQMIVEASYALILDHDRLPAMGKRGGCLTSVTAIGPDLLQERLTKTGLITFELDENPAPSPRASKL